MKKTPWVRQSQGSLTSDRVNASHRAHAGKHTAASNKTRSASQTASGTKGNAHEQPKSRAVRQLETLLEGLYGSSQTLDPSGEGCFCQARSHPLSSYTPICRNCGLVICEVHQPFLVCPNGSCGSPLLSAMARDALITQLEAQIVDTLDKEEQARLQAAEDARKAEGAFPALAGTKKATGLGGSGSGIGSGSGGGLRSHPINQTHTVVSIKSKKQMVVSSYTHSTSSSRSSSIVTGKRGKGGLDVGEISRVPAPSSEAEAIGIGLEVAKAKYVSVKG